MRYTISEDCFKKLSATSSVNVPLNFIIDTNPGESEIVNCEIPTVNVVENCSKLIGEDEAKKEVIESTFDEDIQQLISKYENPDNLMKKSVITEGFEKLHQAPKYIESKSNKKMKYRAEKQKTKGPKWFNMPATELTPERRRDLQIISMQSVLDPKRFYKHSKSGVSKFFQMGKVVESKADFYHSRLPKKQRKQTILEEVMADKSLKDYHKKKYEDIVKTKVKKPVLLKKLQKVKRNQRSFRTKDKKNKQ